MTGDSLWMEEKARDLSLKRSQRSIAIMVCAARDGLSVAAAGEKYHLNTDAGHSQLYRARTVVSCAGQQALLDIIEGRRKFDTVFWEIKEPESGKRPPRKAPPPPPPPPPRSSQERLTMQLRTIITEMRSGDATMTCLQAGHQQKQDILRQLGELQWIAEYLRDKLEKPPPDDWNASSFRSIPDYVQSPAARS